MPDLFISKDTIAKNPEPGSIENAEAKVKSNLVSEKKLPEILDGIKKNKVAEKAGALEYPLTKEAAEKLPGYTSNPLASYIYFPTRADFVNKDPQERIVLILRRHAITNIKWVIASFFLIIAPSFFTILPPFESIPASYQVFAVMAWYLLVFAYMFEKFLDWFFSVNIITDERIFDVDFYNLIYRKMTDANIDQIQDVTVQLGGGIRTMFNYGDVLVQTASEVPEIEFEAVPFPDKVAKVLRELRIEEEVEKLEGRVR
ncbi:MAG TPA: hypothetical protein VI819_03575 [Patescibacteria group bacterium]|nr:hypothetical protein [Patescibacteria group bacterium]